MISHLILNHFYGLLSMAFAMNNLFSETF